MSPAFGSGGADAGAVGAVKQDQAHAIKRRHLRVSAEDAAGVLGLPWPKGWERSATRGCCQRCGYQPFLYVYLHIDVCVRTQTHTFIYVCIFIFVDTYNLEKKILLLLI